MRNKAQLGGMLLGSMQAPCRVLGFGGAKAARGQAGGRLEGTAGSQMAPAPGS